MLQRSLKVSRHAQQFAVRVVRIRFRGQKSDIAIHGRKGLGKFAVAGVHVSQIVQRGWKILVDGQRFLEQSLRLIVAVFRHQPVGREIKQVLVLGIHLEQVIHGGDAADEIAFLHLDDPSDHQLLAGSQLRH